MIYYIQKIFFYSWYFQDKSKKKDSMSLDEAVDDSENLTDFLLDFDEEE